MVTSTSSSTSTNSAILGALGGGSGVDMVKLASDLADARYAGRIAQINANNEKLDLRISAASNLRSQISGLATAIGDRIRTGDLATTPTIGNSSVANVTLAAGMKGEGSYSLEVTQLASAQNLLSNPLATSSTLVGEGQLTIRFGTVSGTSFAADATKTAVDIAVSATDTLSDVATKINAANAGLTAYIANGTSGAQLMIKGKDGANNGFVIEASGASMSAGTPAAGNIDYLAFDPATQSSQIRQSAKDALFKLDTVQMSSASNDVSGLPGGLSMKLKNTNLGAPTTIGFSDPSSSITGVMGDLVTALNEIGTQLRKDADPIAGDLGSDPGARRMKRELSQLAGSIIMPSASGDAPRTLGDLGLKLNRDGSFSLDPVQLNKALAKDPAGAAAMFTTGLHGVYGSIDKMARNLSLKTDPGSLGGSVARFEKQKIKNTDLLAEIADEQDRVRARMVKQFSGADSRVSASQSTLSFLKNQIDAWNNSNG